MYITPAIRSSSYNFENIVSDYKIQGTRWLLLLCSCFAITLAQIDATNCKLKRRFPLGLGELFKPNPLDISDSEDDKRIS